MDTAPGAQNFAASGAAYDSFMGRYSQPLARTFVAHSGVRPGDSVLDVGCGPGALTRVLVELLGAPSVAAIDPSPSFVDHCAAECPGVEVALGRAESLPYEDHRFDAALSQLVFHFVSDPETAVTELARVVRPGGTLAACVWDFGDGMEMLRHFWDAALTEHPDAPAEHRTLRFGRPGELFDLFTGAGLADVVETTLDVAVAYRGFDELWSGFLAGIGPAGAYCVALEPDRQAVVRDELYRRIGAPAGAFTLGATARSARGTTPD